MQIVVMQHHFVRKNPVTLSQIPLFIALLALSLVNPSTLFAQEFPLAGGDWSHELGIEWRSFRKDGSDGQEKRGISFTYLGEYYKSWDASSFTFKPYVRWDQNDKDRTHYDIRELYWDYAGDGWETAIGFNKVYWGRLEFSNIVDIINQDDFVDNQDEKMGQPMIKFSWESDEGILDLYVLTGFRERTFPGRDGRLRLPLPVDTDNAQFDDDGAIYGLDFAARWLQMVGDYTEIAISHFSGMGREPAFSFNFSIDDPMLIPVYEHIDQTGFEAEWLYEGWALKFEAISVSGQGDRFSVLAGGLEYTFGDIAGSGHDITVVLENIHDSREGASPTFLERDVAIGLRWAANNEAGTEGLGGMFYDPQTEERLIAIEGSQRIGDDWKVFVRANVILERAQAPAPEQSVLDDLVDLASNPQLTITDEAIVEGVNLLVSGELFDIIQNPSQLDNLLTVLRGFTDQNRKLNALADDDYFEVQVVRFF